MTRARTTVVIFLAWSFLASVFLARPASSQNKTARDQAEKAIRSSVFETMKAFLTVDVPAFKRHSTQRTLNLVNLVYEAALEDPRFQDELRTARITNAEEFLRFFMQGMANQYLQASPMPPEQAAKRAATDAAVSFITDSEAKIVVGDSELARAKLIAKEWKIDLTDLLKRAVLNEVKDPQMRARIKSF